MPMDSKQIAELRDTCQETVQTYELIRYGEAAQLQQHPEGGVNRVKMYDRLILAQWLGLAVGHPAVQQKLVTADNNQRIRANLAATVTAGNPLPMGNLSPQGNQGHTDPRAAVFPAFEENDAHKQVLTENGGQFFGRPGTQTAISPANRFLALCMFAMQDAIMASKSRGEAVDADTETEINNWMKALPDAQKKEIKAQALADLDALQEGQPLPAIGQGLGQEMIPTIAVNYLIAQHAYDNSRSAAAAKARFEKNWVHSKRYGTSLFLDSINVALPLAADPTHANVIGLSNSARRVYCELLENMRRKLEKELAAIRKAAENYFRTHILSEQSIPIRESAIHKEVAAILEATVYDNPVPGKLTGEEMEIYSELLSKQLTAIGFSRKYFDRTITGIANIQVRLKKIAEQQAIITSTSAGNSIPEIGTPESLEVYSRLLEQHRRDINSAQGYFDAQFSARKIPDLKERREAIAMEIEGHQNRALKVPEVFKANLETYRIYLQLLENMYTKLEAEIKATPPPSGAKAINKPPGSKAKPRKK